MQTLSCRINILRNPENISHLAALALRAWQYLRDQKRWMTALGHLCPLHVMRTGGEQTCLVV